MPAVTISTDGEISPPCQAKAITKIAGRAAKRESCLLSRRDPVSGTHPGTGRYITHTTRDMIRCESAETLGIEIQAEIMSCSLATRAGLIIGKRSAMMPTWRRYGKSEEMKMRCLLSHKWNMEKLFHFASPILHGKPNVYHRRCDRCGAVQRGIYDILRGGILWETLRKHDQSCWQEIRIVRQRASRFEQLVHSLNLRRSRTSDRLKSQKRSVPTSS